MKSPLTPARWPTCDHPFARAITRGIPQLGVRPPEPVFATRHRLTVGQHRPLAWRSDHQTETWIRPVEIGSGVAPNVFPVASETDIPE